MKNLNLKYSAIFLAISEIFLSNAYSQSTSTQEILIESNKVSDSEKSVITQKEAPNYINVINAEEINQIPSFNPADVVRTLPGVSEAHDTGEARYVYIRGMDADYNSTTFDGVKLLPAAQGSPANGGGGRAVAFDSIPTGLVDSITVTKTLRPDQNAEAIGGTIDITTKEMPLDGKDIFFNGKIGTGYETLHSTPLFEGAFTMGFRFGSGNNDSKNSLTSYSDKPFSLILFGSLAQDKRAIEDLEPSPNVGGKPPITDPWDQRYYDYTRTRHGYGINLTFQPSAKESYYIKAFDTGYIEKKSDNIVTVNDNSDASPSVNSNGSYSSVLYTPAFKHTLADHQEQINNKVVKLGGKNLFDNNELDYFISFAQGQYSVDYDYSSKFAFNDPNAPVGGTYSTPLTFSTSGSGGTPVYNLSSIVNPSAYLNPLNYSLYKSAFFTELSTDHEYTTGVNLKTKVSFGNFESESFKYGVNLRFRGKDVQYGEFAATSASMSGLTAANFSSGQIGNFYNGQYNNGPLISTGLIQNRLTYVPLGPTSSYYAPLEYQHNTENVYAGYGQYEFKQGRWSVLGGARYEFTNTTLNSNGFDQNGNIVPNNTSNSFGNIFPSIQGKYELQKDTFIRFAYSTGIARATFNQLNPAASNPTFDGFKYSFSSGNTALKPTIANSFDLSLEKYLNKGGVVSIGVFDKELTDVIASRLNITNGYSQGGLVIPGGTPVYNTTFLNTSGARMNGIELNYVQKFDGLLSGVMSGFGTSANFTLINSKFEQNPGEFSVIPGTSKNIANASIFYDKYGYFARVGINYASASLYALGANVANNNYYDSRTFLDASVGYQLKKNYQIYLSASNLLNTPLTYYTGEPSQINQREFYGPTIRAGVNVNF